MLFEHIGVIGEQAAYQPDRYVGVRGHTIAYIGDTPPEEDFGQRYDGRGKVLLPAFVNAHSHSPMTLLRGYGENLALEDWLQTRIFPFEAKMTGDDVYYGAMLAFAEMLRYGVVSTTDMYYHGDKLGQAVLDSGVKCNMSIGVTCFDNRNLWELESYQQCRELLTTMHQAGGGRLRLDLSIHAEYTSTPKIVAQMADFARETGLRMHIHLSETKKEHEECKARHKGMTPAQYFRTLGLLDAPTTAAHCVWLEGEDFDILSEKGVTVVNNPISNLKLASGFCQVPELLRRSINVALGTDSVASNNNLNIMEEIKLFALLYKGLSGDPTLITPAQALTAATRNGALSQGRTDCGLLQEGYRADLAVIDSRGPWMHPAADMLSNLVYSAQGSDVCLTMADGRVLYRDGEYTTLDIERILFEVETRRARILSELAST